jgi:hypothetical protein
MPLNCYVERYHKTYKKECLEIFRPATLEEVKAVTEEFQQHSNQQRPHQGRGCRNQPPAVAHPVLPTRPALPATVDPDRLHRCSRWAMVPTTGEKGWLYPGRWNLLLHQTRFSRASSHATPQCGDTLF